MKKSCSNCKNFYQHYGKNSTTFHKLACGHCFARNISTKTRASFPFIEGCELWESAETVKEERKNDVLYLLNDMRDKLSRLVEVFENDKPF